MAGICLTRRRPCRCNLRHPCPTSGLAACDVPSAAVVHALRSPLHAQKGDVILLMTAFLRETACDEAEADREPCIQRRANFFNREHTGLTAATPECQQSRGPTRVLT
jgi:hypothetical protein